MNENQRRRESRGYIEYYVYEGKPGVVEKKKEKKKREREKEKEKRERERKKKKKKNSALATLFKRKDG